MKLKSLKISSCKLLKVAKLPFMELTTHMKWLLLSKVK